MSGVSVIRSMIHLNGLSGSCFVSLSGNGRVRQASGGGRIRSGGVEMSGLAGRRPPLPSSVRVTKFASFDHLFRWRVAESDTT